MKGQVLHFDVQKQTGLISTDSDARYNFTAENWKSPIAPTQGLTVDFMVDGNEAIQIFAMPSDAPVSSSTQAVHQTPVTTSTNSSVNPNNKNMSHVLIGLLVAALLAAVYLIFSMFSNNQHKAETSTPPTAAPIAQTPVVAAPATPAPITPPVVLPVNPAQGAVQPPVTVQGARIAYVYAPPSNVRTSPTGPILCVLSQRTSINVYGYAGVTWDGARKVTWYSTDACGSMGVIAHSQIR